MPRHPRESLRNSYLRQSARCRQSATRRLRFESLEDRRVLTTLWVDPTAPNGTTIFAKIGDAVTAAHSGDTVKVVAGSYLETVNVVKPLTIIGGQVRVPNGSSGSSVIQSSPAGIGFFLNANNITIKSFTFRFENIAVFTNGAFSGFRILNNHFEQNTTGIECDSSLASTLTSKIAGNTFNTGAFGSPVPTDSINVEGQAHNVTISGNSFQAADVDAAIRVSGLNTSKNVQILNNVFSSASSIKLANISACKVNGNTITNPAGAAAIELGGNVTGSEVANNVFYCNAASPPHAILLDHNFVSGIDTGNKIHGNTIDGFAIGVYAFIGTGNTISGNTITHSKSDGVLLDFAATSNTVSSNTITDNLGNGIEVKAKNSASKNIASNNGLNGISLFESNSSSIWGNTVNHNAQAGINLSLSTSNLVSGNVAKFNQAAGIFLGSTSNQNILSGNNASFNDAGVTLSNSTQNTLSSNTAKFNHNDGFMTDSSANSNTLVKNIANNNLACGFNIRTSSNTLTSNTASFNGADGIKLAPGTIFNNVQMNIANSNGGSGFDLIQCGGTLIHANTANANALDGIRLVGANNNAITNNIVKNNINRGIAATFNSVGNVIRANTATGNGDAFGGYDLLDDSGMTTKNTWSGNVAKTRFPIGLL